MATRWIATPKKSVRYVRVPLPQCQKGRKGCSPRSRYEGGAKKMV
ncbi:hypothetical protein EVA_20759 [gut metagenome]|uniref:Uncharacterized protein n=1 Tax=gut metagenome TaxID=749906 RepID=J9FUW5_9ZZZZ